MFEFPKAIYHPDSKLMQVVYDAEQEAQQWIEWGVKTVEEAVGIDPQQSAPAVDPAPSEPPVSQEPAADPASPATITENNV